MAGSLAQVATSTVTSSTASVTLTGINTDDVYMVTMSGMQSASDSQIYARVTTSGTADTDSEYDYANKYLKADASFANDVSANNDRWTPTSTLEANYGGYAMIMYLYNFNNSSEYSYMSSEEAHIQSGTTTVRGLQGGGVHTVAEANDGISFSMGSGNIESGTFTLYKVV
jgi:hypothetical protein